MDINVKILNKIVWGTKTDIALLVKSISLCGEVQVVVKITNADTYQTTGESITVTTVNCTTIKDHFFFVKSTLYLNFYMQFGTSGCTEPI